MKPNKAMTPHSDSKREPKIGMTVHASSAIPVLPSATLLSLLQVREHANHRTVQDISGCLTPCSIFKVVLFVCSESVIPAVPNREGDRVSPLCPCGKEP